jgi:putative aldouronate transport system permease protein
MIKFSFTRRSAGEVIFDVVVFILCLFVFLVIAYPLFFVIIASVSDSTLVSRGLVIFYPKGFSTFGFHEILKDTRIWTGYRNTFIYTFGGTALNLALTLPAAYVLSRYEFRPRRFLMMFFVITMFFNGGLIPTYVLIKGLHLTNNMLVFILPFSVNVFNLIITRTFIEHSIPKELYEAASMDGCTHFRYFFKIVLPLSKAVISVIGLYYLVAHWNDFFTGLIYVRKNELQPLQIVLRDILLANQVFSQGAGAGGAAGGYAQRFADQVKYGVIIVSTLPILLVYPFVQKYFEKGVMIGSVKG